MRCWRSQLGFIALLAPPTSAQVEWRRLTPPAAPGPRCCTDLAYDSARSRAVIFGGFRQGFLNETWEWSGTTWLQLQPQNSPGKRDSHSMAFDPARSRVVLYGGGTDAAEFAETWLWDGVDWLDTGATGPPALRGAGMAFDDRRGVMVMFGGASAQKVTNGTWEWDGSAWRRRVPATSPPARGLAGMAFDARRGCMVLFGGGDPFQLAFLGDTWEYDGTTWTQRAPANPPPARMRHELVWDAARGRIVMFGGQDSAGVRNDTWEWDGGDWTQRAVATPPPARRTFGLEYDPKRQRLLLFGGSGTSVYGDTWDYGATAPAGYEAFARGCPGTAGTPTLAATHAPWLGDKLLVQITDLPPAGATTMVLGASNTMWGGVPLPLELGPLIRMAPCQLLVSPDAFLPLGNSNGTATWAVAIPNLRSLVGGSFYNQAFAVDPPANFIGVITSNGGAATIGAR